MGHELVGFDAAVADVDDAVGLSGDVVFVGDQDDGVSVLVQMRKQGHDFRAGLRIEIPRRLIGEHNRGRIHQRARDGDALPLTAGKFVRFVVGSIAETHDLERTMRFGEPFAGRNPAIDEREFDVVQRRRPGEKVERLEDESDLFVPDGGELVVI